MIAALILLAAAPAAATTAAEKARDGTRSRTSSFKQDLRAHPRCGY
jgi:hypothetical protein